MDNKDEVKDGVEKEAENSYANLTKVADLLGDIPLEKRQPFVDLIKSYLNDEI